MGIYHTFEFSITDKQLLMWEFNSATENLYWWIKFLHLVNCTAITALIKTENIGSALSCCP